jgi:hypothetical protein
MRSIRPALLILFYLGLIGYVGSTNFSIAGQTDVPHQAHMEFLRGPGMGGDASACLNCHTDGTPGQGNVDLGACNSCHSPGGAYDGINDPNVGVLNNWENIGSSDPADAIQSMIYDGDTLRPGKEKWCATCHDRGTGIIVDDFEAYGNDAGLQSNWSSSADAEAPYLEPFGGAAGSQCMRVVLDFDRSTNSYGTVKRDYDPALGLAGMESISFYVKIEGLFPGAVDKIKVRLTKPGDPDDVVCVGVINADNLAENSWELVSIPLSDFTNNDIPGATLADQGVKRIALQLTENTGTSSWYDNVYFEDIGFSGFAVQAPDVVGDNVTQGYYVTGHRFGCTSCHDPGTNHLDGEARSLYGYFTSYSNPTGFRLYTDPGYGLQLPYSTYVPGPEGSFALCYQCHDEAVITQDEDAAVLATNFAEAVVFGTTIENLHLYHVGGPGSNMTPLVFHGTCVLCHDPHGQSNPAMTRTDMGDFFYFDANGCEISLGADSDGDGTEDWYDSDVNMGGAQKENKATSYPMCANVCHTVPAAPSDPCTPYTGYGSGWYGREYEYVPHDENMDVGPICLTAGCHPVGQLHAAHFEPAPGPDLPLNEEGCDYCHDDGRVQCQGAPVFADHELFADTTVCDACHNGGGP